jgi:hypothetical protein
MTPDVAAYCYAMTKTRLDEAKSDLARSKRNLDEANEKSRLYSIFKLSYEADKEVIRLHESRLAYFEGAVDALSLGFLKTPAGSAAMSAYARDEDLLSKHREHQRCVNSCPLIESRAMMQCVDQCIKKGPAELHRIRRCAAFSNNRNP